MQRFTAIQITKDGFEGRDSEIGGAFSARFDLFLIREAWGKGCDFEDLANGFGEGLGTMGGDWSGIRDSSPAAVERMFERAINHIFA